MNIYCRLILLLCLSFTANTHATITCSAPKLSKPVEHDSIYHFKAVVTCNLVGEPINITTLKDAYRDEIVKHGSQFVVHSQKSYDNKKGMNGYAIDATQSYNTDRGHVVVRADILLLDDNSKNFYLELRSKSVHGEDDAKYNKYIFNSATLQLLPDHAELTIVKEIDVEEPWYAPESMFLDTVEKDLVSSIRQAASLHTRKIHGDKVDAMRK